MRSVDVISYIILKLQFQISNQFFPLVVIFSLYAKDINSVVTKDDVINYTTKYSDGWNLENISNLFDEVIYFCILQSLKHFFTIFCFI